MKRFLTAYEVAGLLGIDRATVTRWIKKGKVKGATRSEGKQQWQIPLETYKDLLKQHENR